jgi:hypothetical protein
MSGLRAPRVVQHLRRGTVAATLLAALLVAVLFVVAPASVGAAAADDALPELTVVQAPFYGGTPWVGGALGGQYGTWSQTPTSYQFQWYRNGQPIGGATDRLYTLTTDDQGQALSYSVTPILVGYTTPPYFVTINSSILGTFTTGGPPTVVGTPREGQQLVGTASPFSPSDAAVTVTYEWWDSNGTLEKGPDATNYTPTAADVGQQLHFWVILHRPGYENNSEDLDFPDSVLPATLQSRYVGITGTPEIGQTLSAVSQWNTTPDAVAYQWTSGGADIDGATQPTYQLAASDVGNIVGLRATATLAGFDPLTVMATTSTSVTQEFPSPPQPTITGTPRIASVLTAHPGNWAPAGATFLYQWSTGTYWSTPTASNTYLPLFDTDLGSRVSVRVIATAPGYGPTTSQASAPTAPVQAVVSTLSRVTIKSYVGINDLVVPTFTVGPQNEYGPPLTFTWLMNGVAIPGATEASYLPTLADYGGLLSVRVSIDSSAWTGASETSPAVKVGKGDLSPGDPLIDGAPRVGTALVADSARDAGWGPGPVRISYQWWELRDGFADRIVSRSSTFTPPASMLGRQLQLYESASEPHFHAFDGWMLSQVVTIGRGALTYSQTPSIAGFAAVGTRLVASAGSWSPVSGVGFSYQWYSAATGGATPTPIPHANVSTYLVAASQLGRIITVRITARKSAYATVVVASSALSPVRPTRVARPPTLPRDRTTQR